MFPLIVTSVLKELLRLFYNDMRQKNRMPLPQLEHVIRTRTVGLCEGRFTKGGVNDMLRTPSYDLRENECYPCKILFELHFLNK